MNPEQFFARLRQAAISLSGKQLGSLGVAFLAVVSLTIGSAYYLNTPTYGVLFSDMDSDTASSLVTKLKTAKVDYVLDDGGKTIRVPTSRVNDLRLQFAADGMPGSGNVGFGIFDKTAFGVTDFVEHVNYRRALEGELARTISSLSEVAGARVHVAMPQPSLFTGRDQQTKASVILKLRSNRQLAPATVQAITGIVSASIEQLRPEAVVIIDNYGRPLTKSADGGDSEGVSLERQQRIERDLTTRVVTMLEPTVGVGRVRVNISAKLNSVSAVTSKRILDPATVVVSSATSTQTTGGPGSGIAGGVGATGGIAGAQTNLPPDPDKPPAPAPAPIGGALGSSQSDVKVNNDHGEETVTSQLPAGDIVRLSVAVLLDDSHQPGAVQSGQPAAATIRPRTPEEIQKIQGLVATAVGLDTERGDQLTVENMTFEETPVEEPVAQTAFEKYGPQGMEALRVLGIVLLVVAAIFGVIRPMVTGSLGPAVPAVRGALAAGSVGASAAAGARTVQDLEAEMDAQLTTPEALKMPVLTRRMAALTQKEPENAARLLRTWLNEEQ